jgi:hypothetical protein
MTRAAGAKINSAREHLAMRVRSSRREDVPDIIDGR